jgi:hypothetical protein
MSDYRRGFGLDVEFIDLLQVLATSNYNSIANFYTLQFTLVHANSFRSAVTSHFLITASNSGDSLASALTLLVFGKYPQLY